LYRIAFHDVGARFTSPLRPIRHAHRPVERDELWRKRACEPRPYISGWLVDFFCKTMTLTR